MVLELGGALNPTSLVIENPDMTQEVWETIGRMIGFVQTASRWWIADWMNIGEERFGENAAQGADDLHSRFDIARRITGLEGTTLDNMRSTARKVPADRRREELSFGHHQTVQALEPEDQGQWLQKAIDETWTRSELRDAIRGLEPGGSSGGTLDGAGGSTAPPGGDGLTVAGRIERAAQLVYRQAQLASDGSAVIPPEPWAQFTAALGEE